MSRPLPRLLTRASTPHGRRSGPTLLVGAVGVLSLMLAGCSSADPSTEGGDDRPVIVASTDVYASIAREVAGDAAQVTAIIDSPVQDPHSYEASAQDRLAVSRADLVIVNGGGYDPFMEDLIEASGADGLVVLEASELSGLLPEGEHTDEGEHPEDEHTEGEHTDEGEHADHGHIEGFNEHVWYSLEAIDRLARALATELAGLDPAQADAVEDRYAGLAGRLAEVTGAVSALRSQVEGTPVAVTEPVPLYLLESLGLVDRTPEEFSEAVEEGADVPPAVLRDALAQVEGGEVRLLARNAQTTGPETERLARAAEAAGVPVVDFTETLPEGEDYVSWMTANLDAVAEALGKGSD